MVWVNIILLYKIQKQGKIYVLIILINLNIWQKQKYLKQFWIFQRQIIRYRATATLRRPKINQYTASKEGKVTNQTGKLYNFDKVYCDAPNDRFGK